MERKQHFQIGLNSAASVRVLRGEKSSGPIAATVASANGKMLTLSAGERITPGAAVRIDVEGGLVLAEVASCSPAGNDHVLNLCIDQVIPSVSDLARLMEAIMNSGSPARRTADAAPYRR